MKRFAVSFLTENQDFKNLPGWTSLGTACCISKWFQQKISAGSNHICYTHFLCFPEIQSQLFI